MSKKFKKFTSFIVLVVLSSLLIAGCGKKADAPANSGNDTKKNTLKVALLLSGPINDGGWNTDAYNGLMLLKDKGCETAYTENCKPNEIETILRTYAKNGYNYIVGHGFEYGDALNKVAGDFPDVKFLQIGGPSQNGTNLASGSFRYGELAYVAAGIAARTTKTNKIGFVGAMDIPSTQAEVTEIKRRAAEVNPNVAVTVAYTGSWTDVAKGKEAALAQINTGCDVIIGIGDACDVGAIQACDENKDKGVQFIGWSGDMNALSPDLVLTSGVQSVAKIIDEVGQSVIDGKFVAEAKIYGMAEGKEFMGTFSPKIDAKVKEQALQEQDDIISGKIKIKDYNAGI